jgi:hypothetical protein
MMEQFYHCDSVPRASLVRTSCTTDRWGWGLGRRHYWMHFTTPCNPSYVVLTLKCVYVYTDNVCNEGVFQISFPQFFLRGKMWTIVYRAGGKMYVILYTMSVKKKKVLPSIIWFSQCYMSINALVVLNILWYRILGARSVENS